MNDAVIKHALEIGENLSFILESGDKNSTDATRIFWEVKGMSSALDKAIYSFGFADKNMAIGLQFADLLAVTSRRYINRTHAQGSFADEPAILTILRDRIHLIDDVAVQFVPSM